MNLYYDPHHTHWYKRPDWYVVLGAAPSQEIRELRLSYVIWQEEIVPYIVVELLSPGTEKEDLGQSLREIRQPPSKWEVYEQILRVPYYIIYSRYTQELKVFENSDQGYQLLSLPDDRLWLPTLRLGLGIWEGAYEGVNGRWLRWYDTAEEWLPSKDEQTLQQSWNAEQERQRAEQERQRAEQERQRADALAAKLRVLGIDPDEPES